MANPVVLYDVNQRPMNVENGVAIPANTQGVLIVGSDGTTARTVRTDASGNLLTATAGGGFGGQVEGRAADGAAPVGNPVLMGGSDGTLVQALLTDVQGRVIIAPAGAATQASGFSFGEVTLAAVGVAAAVRKTALIEQTTNAQRSIASANANDTAAGTGARQVIITYLTATFTGPFTETVTLNGVAFVNTVATNICYVEKIEVVSVGSTGSNVGILTLKAATAGGGATIGTVAATDNRTLWAIHYTPTGKTSHITSISANNNSSAVGNGCAFTLRAYQGGTTPDIPVSDFVRVYGQSSGVTRTYGTPIEVIGPARLQVWATPESNISIVERASFDYYDEDT